jgi:hypothetical protein
LYLLKNHQPSPSRTASAARIAVSSVAKSIGVKPCSSSLRTTKGIWFLHHPDGRTEGPEAANGCALAFNFGIQVNIGLIHQVLPNERVISASKTAKV